MNSSRRFSLANGQVALSFVEFKRRDSEVAEVRYGVELFWPEIILPEWIDRDVFFN
jgi:hypothetical protein